MQGQSRPGRLGRAAAFPDKERELFGGEPATTNNRMELMAVIEALSALSPPCHVRLHTDSRYVQQGITEWIHNWKRRGWRTADKKPVKNADLWRGWTSSAHATTSEWIWVKGHSGHDGNERADALANRGVEAGGPA